MEQVEQQLIEAYSELKKKYKNLPSFDKIEKDFEIKEYYIEKKYMPSYLIRYVRRRIVDYFWNWVNYLHSITFPNQNSAILMKEMEFYDDEEKKKIIFVINKLMIYNRESIGLEILKDEKQDAKFIAEAYEEWQELRKIIEPIVKKNIDSWREELNKNEK